MDKEEWNIIESEEPRSITIALSKLSKLSKDNYKGLPWSKEIKLMWLKPKRLPRKLKKKLKKVWKLESLNKD